MKSVPILLYISIVVFAGVMLGIMPALVVLTLMILSMFSLNRHESIIAITFGFVPVLGVFFSHYGIGIPSSLLCLALSFILSIGEVGCIIIKNKNAFIYTLILWAILFFYYILTGKTENSTDKIIVMSELVLLYSIAVFIMASSTDIRLERIAPIMIFSGIFLIAAAHDYSGYPAFHGLFDFETIRLEYSVRKHSLEGGGMSYHRIGMQVMCAVAFYLSTCKNLDFRSFVLLFVCAWIALVSGARQAILGVVVIVAAWIVLKNGRTIRIWNIVLSIIAIGVLVLGIQSLELDLFSGLFETDSTIEESTGRDYLYPLMVIQSNPLFGLGFGNYENPFIDGEVYPHNLILEILCEMGIIGLSILTIVFIVWFFRERPKLLQRIKSGGLSALIVLPFFIRSMISEDLSHNFVLFVLVFTLFANNSNNPQYKYGKS